MNPEVFIMENDINILEIRIQKIKKLLDSFPPKLKLFTLGLGVPKNLVLIKKWELFKNMSDDQFNSFLGYLHEIKESNLKITFGVLFPEAEKLGWLKILTLCAVFSRFMNMTLPEAIKETSLNGISPVRDLFTELFDRYEISNDFLCNNSELENFIYTNFEYSHFTVGSRTHEVDIFEAYHDFYMLLAIKNGYNIRDVNLTDFTISKKESFYFHSQNNLLKVTDANVYIQQRIVASKLAKYLNKDFKILQKYLDASTSFQNDIYRYYTHFSVWKKAFLLLLKANFEEFEITTYVDYIEHKLEDPTNFSLRGKTYRSILQDADIWHESITYDQIADDPISWGKPKDAVERLIVFKNKAYGYHQIIDSLSLYKEGKVNHHCVYLYLEDCKRGRKQVYTLYAKDSQKRLTIEVRDRKIVQALGKYNQPDLFLAQKILPIMAKQEQLILD
jgi:hypothetical protein